MSIQKIRFSEHAKIKFEILSRHGIAITDQMITDIITKPEDIFSGYSGRKIAQGPLDARRVLRVIYEERTDELLIITFYPGKRERYGKSQI